VTLPKGCHSRGLTNLNRNIFVVVVVVVVDITVVQIHIGVPVGTRCSRPVIVILPPLNTFVLSLF
jgi:uncharacterized membrane protein YozB (DUF420 family)